jgi:hypothetical protein
MKFRYVVFLVVLAVVVGVGVAMWRGSGPLPDPEGCSAKLAGRQVDLTTEQAENATLIAAIGVSRGLPARAVSIALATAYQESKIRNLTSGDRDSEGLFQQRPSQGWGTSAQVQDPYYATNAFYDALEKIPDYKTLRITEAAQKVQRSGYPEAYEDHAPDARTLASVLTGYSPGGLFTCVVHQPTGPGSAQQVIRLVTRAYGDLDIRRTGTRQDVALTVPAGQDGTRLGWSVAQFLVGHGVALKQDSVAYAGKTWETGRKSELGWRASTQKNATTVRIGMG